MLQILLVLLLVLVLLSFFGGLPRLRAFPFRLWGGGKMLPEFKYAAG